MRLGGGRRFSFVWVEGEDFVPVDSFISFGQVAQIVSMQIQYGFWRIQTGQQQAYISWRYVFVLVVDVRNGVSVVSISMKGLILVVAHMWQDSDYTCNCIRMITKCTL